MIYALFIKLVAAHFICDYQLQSDTVANQKSPKADNPLSKAVPWYYWMAAHASVHGAAVYLITGSLGLAFLETGAHFYIDVGKCLGFYNIHVDQILHIVCKASWVCLLTAMLACGVIP